MVVRDALGGGGFLAGVSSFSDCNDEMLVLHPEAGENGIHVA